MLLGLNCCSKIRHIIIKIVFKTSDHHLCTIPTVFFTFITRFYMLPLYHLEAHHTVLNAEKTQTLLPRIQVHVLIYIPETKMHALK